MPIWPRKRLSAGASFQFCEHLDRMFRWLARYRAAIYQGGTPIVAAQWASLRWLFMLQLLILSPLTSLHSARHIVTNLAQGYTTSWPGQCSNAMYLQCPLFQLIRHSLRSSIPNQYALSIKFYHLRTQVDDNVVCTINWKVTTNGYVKSTHAEHAANQGRCHIKVAEHSASIQRVRTLG